MTDEPFAGRYKPFQTSSGQFLTLTLDGKMLPWDNIHLDKIEEQPGQFDKVVERLKSLKLLVSIGIRDDYLLLTITPLTDKLAALGTGPRLVERPEFDSIARFADKRLTGLSFTAKEASAALESYQIDNMHNSLRSAFEMIPNVPPETKKGLQHDLDELVTDIKSLMPPPGDRVALQCSPSAATTVIPTIGVNRSSTAPKLSASWSIWAAVRWWRSSAARSRRARFTRCW